MIAGVCVCVCYCRTIKIMIVYSGLYLNWKETHHEVDTGMEKLKANPTWEYRETEKNEE